MEILDSWHISHTEYLTCGLHHSGHGQGKHLGFISRNQDNKYYTRGGEGWHRFVPSLRVVLPIHVHLILQSAHEETRLTLDY